MTFKFSRLLTRSFLAVFLICSVSAFEFPETETENYENGVFEINNPYIGAAYYNSGQFDDAFRVWSKPHTPLGLAWLYERGVGVEQNWAKAAELYQKMADEGNHYGMAAIGALLYLGKGVQQDYEKARFWLETAANNGISLGQKYYGLTYLHGRGTEIEEKMARAYFGDAADQGDAEAKYLVGKMLWEGRGGKKDIVQAIKMFHQAADKYEPKAMKILIELVENGELFNYHQADIETWKKQLQEAVPGFVLAPNTIEYTVPDKMTFVIPNRFDAPSYWLREYAEQKEDTLAYLALGDFHLLGKGIDANLEEALKWYSRIVGNADSSVALLRLGKIYFGVFGKGFVDYEKSHEHLSKILVRGTPAEDFLRLLRPEANYFLGLLYLNGHGVKKDHAKSYTYFQSVNETLSEMGAEKPKLEFANSGEELGYYGEANYLISQQLWFGEGVNKNRQAAIQGFQELADWGHVNSAVWVANQFGFGDEFPKDFRKAEKYYLVAANSGNIEAQIRLARLYFSDAFGEPDYEGVRKWSAKAADQGNSEGQNNLGFLFFSGKGVSQDYSRSFNLFVKSADQGYAVGQRNLGLSYLNGYGVTKDEEQAAKWLKLAADQGDDGAIETLKAKEGSWSFEWKWTFGKEKNN
jgi:TPR repeat protein